MFILTYISDAAIFQCVKRALVTVAFTDELDVFITMVIQRNAALQERSHP